MAAIKKQTAQLSPAAVSAGGLSAKQSITRPDGAAAGARTPPAAVVSPPRHVTETLDWLLQWLDA